MKIHTARPAAAYSRERGFTLIELMVASTLALVMLVGVSELYLSTKSTETTNAGAAELTTNGRYVIDLLRRELMHAGYRGITWAPPSDISPAVGAVTNDCTGASSGFATNLRQGVWGSNDNDPFSTTCIPAANYSTGDILVVRHAALAFIDPAVALSATTLYFRSAYERGQVFRGDQRTALDGIVTQSPKFDYALETKVYFINKFTNSATESPLVPALYRVALGAGPAMARELVASNIEDMQIRYGRLTTDQNTRFYSANAVSATATSTTTNPTEWDAVNSVRVWILVRSSKPEPGYVNTNTYTLGDKTITVNDGYRREVFTTVVQLRNI